jgi:hypothetical protein
MPWRQLAIGIINVSDRLTAPPARARLRRDAVTTVTTVTAVTTVIPVPAVIAVPVLVAVTRRACRSLGGHGPTVIAMTAVIVGICIARAVTAVTAVPALTAVTRLARVMCMARAWATVGAVIAVTVAKTAPSLSQGPP